MRHLINVQLFVFLGILITRLGALLYVSLFNFTNENGERVSPFIAATNSGDIGFYEKFSSAAWLPLKRLFSIDSLEALSSWVGGDFYPGPLFPWLLNITGYFDGMPYNLSLTYSLIGIACCVMWSRYFSKLSVTLIEQLLIISYPFLIYFTLVVSTDLLFCLFFSMFYILVVSEKDVKEVLPYVLIYALLSIMTRPNALILFPVIAYFIFVKKDGLSKTQLTVVAFVFGLIALVSTLYYLPYFLAYSKASTLMTYWGVSQESYMLGLFGTLPATLNLSSSWLLLGISKLLYVVGIRPSYSNMPVYLVALRSIGGCLMLPGILHLLRSGSSLERVILLLFLLPILTGVSQERYLLPICPILIYYGTRFWKEFGIKLLNKIESSRIYSVI